MEQRPLNILHLTSARHFGGGEKHLIDLTRGLHHQGHHVSVLLRSTADWKEQLNHLPYDHVIELPLRNALDLSSAIKLSRLVKKLKVDVIHAHLARDYFIASLAAKLNRSVKLVITRHVLFPLGKIHLLTFKLASAVIAVSNAVARVLIEDRLVDLNKLKVIPNGVDVHEFAPTNRHSGTDHVIGMVGELSSVKNQA
ncbi:MAG: glycosyltransferase family 4 protein, partial [Pyrinomonadaceae bacterium]